MAKKGDTCKEKLTKAILDLYPNNAFIQDKNIYVNFIEGGETIQLKLTVTQPKVPIGAITSTKAESDSFDWSGTVIPNNPPTAEITQQEQDNLRALLEKLGL